MGVGANCDIQPILDQTALVNYILKYAMKTEKKSLAFIDAFKEILKGAARADLDVKTVCMKALNHGVADRDYTAQEVSHVLLGLPLVHMSRAHVPLSFSGSVEVLPDDDGEPTTCKKPTFVDWYTARPDEHRDVCAYEMAACYAFTTNDAYLPRLRMVFPVVKPYTPFHAGDPLSVSNIAFYKQTLMLYRPWTHESHLLHGLPPPTPSAAVPASSQQLPVPPDQVQVWHDAYHAWLLDAHKMVQRHHSAALTRHEAFAREAVARHDAKVAREEAGLPESSDDEALPDDADADPDDDMQLFRTHPRWEPPYEPDADFAVHARRLQNITLDELGGRYQARHEELAAWLTQTQANHPDPPWNPESVRDVHLSQLRDAQLRAVRIVDNEVLAHLARAPDASTDAPPPLYLTLKGAGGCGKSHVIKAITKLANIRSPGCLSPGEDQRVALIGPTGPAAFAIGGVTAHSLLSLPRAKRYAALAPARLKVLQKRLKSLRFLILDEHSMVGQKTFGCISLRLQQIKQSALPFGGVSMLIVGDEAQLPPVQDRHKFEAITMTTDSTLIAGHSAYALFLHAVILTRAYRQDATDRMYAMLSRLRDNNHNLADWDLICKRDFAQLSPEAQAPFESAVRSPCPLHIPASPLRSPFDLPRARAITVPHSTRVRSQLHFCAKKESAEAFNRERLLALDRHLVPLKAKSVGAEAVAASADNFMGLHAHLLLAIGARVMLRSNLWTAHGLTNGAMGTVYAIVYAPGSHPAAGDLPVAVVVDFDQYTGPPLHPGTRHVAVPAITVFSETLHNHQTRQQVPLQLGFATTIHKSQGLTVGPGETLTHMTVDLGDKEFAVGLTYVACSRAKSLDCLAFRPVPTLERFVRPHVPIKLKLRLIHDQEQILTAARTERHFAHLANDFYATALDTLLPSVSPT